MIFARISKIYLQVTKFSNKIATGECLFRSKNCAATKRKCQKAEKSHQKCISVTIHNFINLIICSFHKCQCTYRVTGNIEVCYNWLCCHAAIFWMKTATAAQFLLQNSLTLAFTYYFAVFFLVGQKKMLIFNLPRCLSGLNSKASLPQPPFSDFKIPAMFTCNQTIEEFVKLQGRDYSIFSSSRSVSQSLSSVQFKGLLLFFHTSQGHIK